MHAPEMSEARNGDMYGNKKKDLPRGGFAVHGREQVRHPGWTLGHSMAWQLPLRQNKRVSRASE